MLFPSNQRSTWTTNSSFNLQKVGTNWKNSALLTLLDVKLKSVPPMDTLIKIV